MNEEARRDAACWLPQQKSRQPALQATRDLEQRIAESRVKTRARQDAIRVQILERKKRDFYER